MCACTCMCVCTRSVGGVGRVSHRNITLNPLVIKESNCTMESESEAEKIERKRLGELENDK